MNLHVKHYGTSGSPIVILHGMLGSGRNWHSVAQTLALEHRVIAVDLRNHGQSPRSLAMNYDHMVRDVCSVIQQQSWGIVHVLGHSMGGKVAMALALTSPDLVRSLTVVDIAPAEYQDRYSAMIRSMGQLDLDSTNSRADIDDRLARSVPDRALRQFLLTNLAATPGGYRWRVDLGALEQALPDLLSFPHFGRDTRCAKPALFISGRRSDYIAAHHRSTILRLFPAARFNVIEGAGHWPHFENPSRFMASLQAFLRTSDQAADQRFQG